MAQPGMKTILKNWSNWTKATLGSGGGSSLRIALIKLIANQASFKPLAGEEDLAEL